MLLDPREPPAPRGRSSERLPCSILPFLKYVFLEVPPASRMEPAGVSGMGQPLACSHRGSQLTTSWASGVMSTVLTSRTTVRFLILTGGMGIQLLPWQPVPMLNNPFGEEIFPNIQSKPPLAQLEAISSRPIACYLGEETDPHLATTSFQAKQPQFPQPLLIRLVLQTLHQLRCPSLDTLQHLHVFLVVRGPKLNTVFESLPTLQQINTPAQFAVVYKLTEGALNPLIQIIDEDIKQNWPQY
ncbi:hypothetical protein QYF61_000301 [Mycteria americana]|uniref:Uncharacterized protein n=1 Tax=Mycteria americana TaxID=33587 RepID=A0AAN7PN38_MYCAM|nr:hypothetical protein QYF61_000301 [Mycteria americana]